MKKEKSYGRLKIGQELKLHNIAKRCLKLGIGLAVETSRTGLYLQLDKKQVEGEETCTVMHLQMNICYIIIGRPELIKAVITNTNSEAERKKKRKKNCVIHF